LARGASEASDPFRFTVLATVGPEGPEARMVGLRMADRTARLVEVHSDARTAKVRAIAHDPRAALLLWDEATQEQLRLSVVIQAIPADPVRWAAIPEVGRLNYGTDPAPGTPVVAPEAVTRRPDIAQHMALRGRVVAMDAVSLAHDPHRRARFDASGGMWTAP
jgi:hypothetical protein